ncbi:protein phosphatase 2C domain-containing protein [Nocardia sp. NPDC005825]|uniref:protein phosphatase 2C domain-containing protein n=1 Tax=unclassified Nocardia TaxID=2637762 RepID=UPI0033CD2B1C
MTRPGRPGLRWRFARVHTTSLVVLVATIGFFLVALIVQWLGDSSPKPVDQSAVSAAASRPPVSGCPAGSVPPAGSTESNSNGRPPTTTSAGEIPGLPGGVVGLVFPNPNRSDRPPNGRDVPCLTLGISSTRENPAAYLSRTGNNGDVMLVLADPPRTADRGLLPAALVAAAAALLTGGAVVVLSAIGDRRPAPASGSVPGETPRPSVAEPPPVAKAARPVELAAVTTSGVSGLTVDRGRSGSFEVYAATQVGLQHARTGHTREDAYAIGGAPEHDWVFLAVADGLGSAENSHVAAQRACRVAIEALHKRVPGYRPGDVVAQWSALARDVAAEVARNLGAEELTRLAAEIGYRDPHGIAEGKRTPVPACTLTFAALGPVGPGGYPMLWAAVGDCDALTVDLGTGATSWLTRNDTKSGGRVSNVTASLPRNADRLVTGSEVLSGRRMVVLASDGMADAIRLVPQQFSTILPELAGPAPAEHVFAEIVGFQLPGLHDDRTIVAAWPVGR